MLHAHTIVVTHKVKDGSVAKINVARDSDLRCRKTPFNDKTFWSEAYPLKTVPKFCTKRFITTVGVLAPMKMHEKIDTYSELEVLEFLEEMQEDPGMLFVDNRKKE